MSGLRRIVNNTLISLFGQMVTWTSTLLLTIAYGRFLGDVKFGELYFAIAFVALVGFPIELGFNQQVTREVAEDPEKAQAYLWNTLLIKVTLWVPLYSIILFAARVLGYSQEQRSIVAICGITLLSASIVNSFAALHYAFERTLFPAVGMMLEKGLSACVGRWLLCFWRDRS
jgi:O-antigen/teichoic acid export membrane protein